MKSEFECAAEKKLLFPIIINNVNTILQLLIFFWKISNYMKTIQVKDYGKQMQDIGTLEILELS